MAVLFLLAGAAAAAAQSAAGMVFYVARGAPGSCGRGCDRWIAAEGQIDSQAAARLRAFLSQQNQNLPLYLYSPGGDMGQAMEMGRMLRRRNATVGVGRTLVKDCANGGQPESCVRFKLSGRELAAELVSHGALCASACPLVLFGGARREVAPDAVLALHSPRVTRMIEGVPTKAMLAEIARQGADATDRITSAYLTEMGIGQGVLGVIQATKSDSIRILTRDEIISFGIDSRTFVETPWAFDRGAVTKSAMEKRDGQDGFRELQWRFSCATAGAYRLEYQHKVDADRTGDVWISTAETRRLPFDAPPLLLDGYETWRLQMPRPSAQTLAQLSELEQTEVTLDSAGRRTVHLNTLAMDGLASSLASLAAVCPAASHGVE